MDSRRSAADALAQMSFAITAMLERRFAEHGVSPSLGRLLGMLRGREPLMREVGAHLRLDKASVSGLVSRAEDRGLVERVRDAHDGRAVRVRLTDEGRRLAADGEAAFTRDVEAMLAPLGADGRETLRTALGVILGPEGGSTRR